MAKRKLKRAARTCQNCGHRLPLSVDEAADYLGVSGQTIRNWVENGRLRGAAAEPGVAGHGYRVVIPVESLDEVRRGAA